MVEFDNGNKESGIRYDNVNFTVGVFLDRNITSPIGSSIIAGFYQGRKKNAKKWSSVETHSGALNGTAKVDGKTYFRVNFTTSVKYKIMFFYTARHRLWGGANVAVNDAGLKDEKDDIRLGHSLQVIESGATPLTTGCYYMLLVLGLVARFVLPGLSL
ncbi:protein NDR1-like [Neltuma alba]|uniref:protein NDR1-like n=1 Tax=Neltuma alba TaxID=207710 RepID=UPI0010A3C58F|nr:protein NDR1-like [Prosopis alba]